MPESPADKAMFAQSKTRMPLNGITVLDLTLARAGPTAVRHFADWGANVIRIEPPASDGEDVAGRRHGFDFQNLHRNKRAITLNLKTPEGHAAFMRLAKTADVIVENMRAAGEAPAEGGVRRREGGQPAHRLRQHLRLRPGRARTGLAPGSIRSRRAWAG